MGDIKTSNEMTQKEKAEELVNKFTPHTRLFLDELGWTDCLDAAKCCAVIAVNEILNTIEYSSQADELSKISYWEGVKNEINKL
jgi:hypothetical protein